MTRHLSGDDLHARDLVLQAQALRIRKLRKRRAVYVVLAMLRRYR